MEQNLSFRGPQVMDETLGALVYMLKRSGQLGDGPAFTARLEVDYRKVSPLNPSPPLSLCVGETSRLWSQVT